MKQKNKTICFIADASSPHTRKWIAGCSKLSWRIVVISHRPGVISEAEVIVQPLTLTGFFSNILAVRRLIKQISPDIIHAHQFGAHGLYALLAERVPVVISAWGSDILINPRRNLVLRWLAQYQIRKASLMTSDSQQLTAALIDLGARAEQILTFPFGITRSTYEQLTKAVKSPERIVICSPRLHEPIYNIIEIIKSFLLIKDEYPQAELWLAGAGSLTGQLQQYVLENNGQTAIKFWGQVSQEQFWELISASDIMVNIPSSDSTPVSLLEGMAAGCLPIVNQLPVYQEWLTNNVNGLIIDSNNSLTDLLRRSILERGLREQAAVINRQIIKERAISDELFQPMLEYYKKAVGADEDYYAII